jgi:hypothetical protein
MFISGGYARVPWPECADSHYHPPLATANCSALKPQDLIVFSLSLSRFFTGSGIRYARAGRIVLVIGVPRVGITGEHSSDGAPGTAVLSYQEFIPAKQIET